MDKDVKRPVSYTVISRKRRTDTDRVREREKRKKEKNSGKGPERKGWNEKIWI